MRKLLFIAIVISFSQFSSCNKYTVKHTIQYFISGNSIMNISCTDASGDLLYINSVNSTWTYSFNAPGDGRTVFLTITSVNGASVGGAIFIDGQEAAINKSDNNGSVTLTTRLP